MYIRLAFAVAAHLEPEILVIDEVLAVGDAQFQRKCLGKMEEVSKNEGRTVLFVSHNMSAIKTLCNSAIVLHEGKKILQGDVFDCLSQYYSFNQAETGKERSFTRTGSSVSQKMYIAALQFDDDEQSEEMRLNLLVKIVSQIDTKICINVRLKDGMGFPVGYGNSLKLMPELVAVKSGTNQVLVRSAPLALAQGSYKLSMELVIPGAEYLDRLEDCLTFELSNDSLSVRRYGVSQDWGYGSLEIEFEKVGLVDFTKNSPS